MALEQWAPAFQHVPLALLTVDSVITTSMAAARLAYLGPEGTYGFQVGYDTCGTVPSLTPGSKRFCQQLATTT